MPKYGSPELKIEIDNAGGTLVDMTEYIDEIGDIVKEALLQEGHAFGDGWVKQFATGVKQGNSFNVGGFYDDTATTGPDAILNAIGDTRTVQITWGSSNITTFEAVIKDYKRKPVRGELTRFDSELVPTGEVEEV